LESLISEFTVKRCSYFDNKRDSFSHNLHVVLNNLTREKWKEREKRGERERERERGAQ